MYILDCLSGHACYAVQVQMLQQSLSSKEHDIQKAQRAQQATQQEHQETQQQWRQAQQQLQQLQQSQQQLQQQLREALLGRTSSEQALEKLTAQVGLV